MIYNCLSLMHTKTNIQFCIAQFTQSTNGQWMIIYVYILIQHTEMSEIKKSRLVETTW